MRPRKGLCATVAAVLALGAVVATAPTAVASSTDLLMTTRGDSDGFHIYLADAHRLNWTELATLRPALPVADTWIGRACLTGDDQRVVAVVAPRSAVNRPDQMAHGGIGYAVDVPTGQVRPLAAGLSLAYFNPGCGAGTTVALTGFRTADETATELSLVDAATGRTEWQREVDTEVTSAVPLGQTIVGVRGGSLVDYRADGTAARTTTLPGLGYDLHPDASGGVTLLTTDPRSTSAGASVWSWRSGTLTHLGRGPRSSVQIFPGAHGQLAVAGATPDPHATGPGWLPARDPSTETMSSALDAEVRTTTATPMARVVVAPTSGARSGTTLPAARPMAETPLPADVHTTTPSSLPNITNPTCAVPRNDPHRQIVQPGNDQIDWAIQHAITGALTSSRTGDPTWGLAPHTPDTDFPLPALSGAAGGATVPREVASAIIAQESNWNQASPHAVPGVAGNPFLPDYYGLIYSANSSTNYISYDYAGADCGYGLTQQTDGMRLDGGGFPANLQAAVGLDYAENVAAGVRTLAGKWNQLAAAGIKVNNGDPARLENWYFAIWAYNSGINPQAKTGNTTGCTPGPSCTDGSGNWGLGWGNNPINPQWRPARQPFLRTTYGDAAHPGDWPYQERVLGFMETPLRSPETGAPEYTPSTGYLSIPDFSTFCTAADHCVPAGSPICQRSDLHCWWHWPITLPDDHVYETFSSASVSPEPPPPSNPVPPVCTLDSSLSGSIVVDDEATGAGSPDVNLAGCPATPGNWRNGGTFTATFGTVGMVDYHQLGAGFGGHMFFTHPADQHNPNDPNSADRTVVGTWTPQLPQPGIYQISVFVPDAGASANATYQVKLGTNRPTYSVTINQGALGNQWAGIGRYALSTGASVALRNDTGYSTNDLAYDAVAFTFGHTTAGQYAALGDSYSSGQGAEDFDADTNTSGPPENQCHRSWHAYPRVYTNNDSTSFRNKLTHVACSGDTTAQLLSGRWNEPSQLAVLTPDTSLVTLTIGGNDIGFADIVSDCVVNGNCATNPKWAQLDTTIQGISGTLTKLYTTVHAQAPNAHIAVLTYPEPFSGNPSDCDNYDIYIGDGNGSVTKIGNSRVGEMTHADITWANQKVDLLDSTIRQAVSNAGNPNISLVDVETAFNDHEICSSNPDINGLFLTDTNSSFHPNADGYTREAQVLSTDLGIS